MKFKVGDKVRFFGTKGNWSLTKGKIYQVVSISDCNIWVRVKDDDGIVDGYHSSNFELVPQYNWTSKFNIGDKVRPKELKENAYMYSGVTFTVNRIEFGWSEPMYVCYTPRNIPFPFEESKLCLWVEPQVEELTLEQVCKELGRDIKIIK